LKLNFNPTNQFTVTGMTLRKGTMRSVYTFQNTYDFQYPE
jgi:hypothetical protein